jgi:hypothetical protein
MSSNQYKNKHYPCNYLVLILDAFFLEHASFESISDNILMDKTPHSNSIIKTLYV